MIDFAINQKAGQKIPKSLWRQWFKKIEKTLKIKKNLIISVGLVGDKEIKKLNQIYRGRKQITDVLSFSELESNDGPKVKNYLGEIVICYPQALRQAKKMGHPVKEELELLLIHGFLHLLGYDHEGNEEAKLMRGLEEKILA